MDAQVIIIPNIDAAVAVQLIMDICNWSAPLILRSILRHGMIRVGFGASMGVNCHGVSGVGYA
jgi:hypothetical protein